MHEETRAKKESNAKPNVAELSDSFEMKKAKPVTVRANMSVAIASAQPAFDSFSATVSGSFRRGGRIVSSRQDTQGNCSDDDGEDELLLSDRFSTNSVLKHSCGFSIVYMMLAITIINLIIRRLSYTVFCEVVCILFRLAIPVRTVYPSCNVVYQGFLDSKLFS